VIETIPLDFLISFIVGHLFVLTAEEGIKSSEWFFDRYLARAVLFQVVVFIPIGLYLYLNWPAWSWMYFIDPHRHPAWIGPLMATEGYLFALLAGYLVAHNFVLTDNKGAAYLTLIMAVVALLTLIFVPIKNLAHVGTYQEFVEGRAPLAIRNLHFSISMVVVGIYFFIPLLFLLVKNLRETR